MVNNIRANGSLLPTGFDPRNNLKLLAYAALLKRWNQKMNLVGRADIDRLWPRHIEDSLFLYSCLPAPSQYSWVLDVGSGGGLPGMVLAIADVAADDSQSEECADEQTRRFVLLDRSDRKVRFLTQVVAQLKLRNVVPVSGDFTRPIAEATSILTPTSSAASGGGGHESDNNAIPDRFGVICARAVAPPDELWDNLQHLLVDKGELLVACGPQTREQLPLGVQVEWYENQASEGRGVVRLFRNE